MDVADAAATDARPAVGQLQPEHQSAGRLVVLAVVQAVQLPVDTADAADAASATSAESGRQEVAEQGTGHARQRALQQQQQQYQQ